ncbi:precorrin-2 C(20)-methyltransferase [Devosia sp. ZB163]|uniref:precorrin-2 C(20)-methyltransferase n=1 Tax=Devosia sp. ZB163 TaxID=3025938 RepID=UPI00235E05C7|nr:precorrin-2 C(20)-methyltransferase [Devosia sp. ZB163]MDC9823177.1 precorrin-2 C(20)-methyltransferase [Devosia sp. ZB163]
MTGTLHLVGVGPGDPELLTLKAVRLLGSVPVVAYPTTGEDSALALEIAAPHIHAGAERLPVAIPMTVERGPAQAAYDGAAERIIGHLEAGRDVAWLCEGDPLFYGSAMYLVTRVGARAPVVVIPGVTSLTAAAAAIGRPLAARNEMLKVLPAPLDDATLRAELDATQAAAIIKVGRHFDRVRQVLAETGHAEGAVVIEHATSTRQRITRLSDFAHDERPYFSTILCYRGDEAWGRT